jgi:hypothetical protein
MILLNSEKKTMYIQGRRRMEGGGGGGGGGGRREEAKRRRRREEEEVSLSVSMTNRNLSYFPNLFTFQLTFLS